MLIFYGLAILAGVTSAIEPGQNAGLAQSFERPLLAGLVSLIVSIATIAAVMAVTQQVGVPSLDQIRAVPWWAWLGGILSAGLTMAQLYVSKRIGAAAFLGIIVTAGVVTSILLDNYGLVGFKPHAAGAGRLIGGALMIAGVGLVTRY